MAYYETERIPRRIEEPEAGQLNAGIDKDGRDLYDFASRAIVASVAREQAVDDDSPLPSPWTVEFEPTLICNSRCHFCSYTTEIANNIENKGDNLPPDGITDWRQGLSYDVVSDTLDSLRDAGTTRGVFFSGGGEPLLWPHIGRGIHNASSFADVSIQTNGISLNKLLREGEEGDVAIEHVRLLSLSLFGHTPELHQQVAGVRSSERIIRNIKEVVAYRDDHDLNLTIMAKILVDRHNYPYLSDIVKFYHDIGAPVSLRAVQDFNYGTDDARPQSVELLAEEKREAVRLIRESPYQHQVLRNFASLLMVQQARPTPTEQCYNATDGHFACIDAHGDVYIGNPEIGDVEYRIGSLAVRSWREIWGSDLHREVIKKMSDRQRASLCSSELCRHALANAGVQRYRAGLVGAPNNEAVLDNLGAFL